MKQKQTIAYLMRPPKIQIELIIAPSYWTLWLFSVHLLMIRLFTRLIKEQFIFNIFFCWLVKLAFILDLAFLTMLIDEFWSEAFITWRFKDAGYKIGLQIQNKGLLPEHFFKLNNGLRTYSLWGYEYRLLFNLYTGLPTKDEIPVTAVLSVSQRGFLIFMIPCNFKLHQISYLMTKLLVEYVMESSYFIIACMSVHNS